MNNLSSSEILSRTVSQLILERNKKEKQNYPQLFETIRFLPNKNDNSEIEQYLSSQIVELKEKLRNAEDNRYLMMKEKLFYVESIVNMQKIIHELEIKCDELVLLNSQLKKEDFELIKKLNEESENNKYLLQVIQNRISEIYQIEKKNEELSSITRDLQEQLDYYKWKPDASYNIISALSKNIIFGRANIEKSKKIPISKSSKNESSFKDVENSSKSISNGEMKSNFNTESSYIQYQEDIRQIYDSNSYLQLQYVPFDSMIISNRFSVSFSIMNNKNKHSVFCQWLYPNKIIPGNYEFGTPLLIMESEEDLTCFHSLESFSSSTYINSKLQRNSTSHYLAASGEDGCIRLMSIRDNMDPKTCVSFSLRGHTARVNALSDCNLSTILISGSDDKSIRLWDFSLQKILFTYKNDSGCKYLYSVPQEICPPLFAATFSDQMLRFYDSRVSESVVNYSFKKNTFGSPIQDLKCSDRYIITSTKENLHIYDYRSIDQGPIRICDIDVLNNRESDLFDSTYNSKNHKYNLSISPCYSYVAAYDGRRISFLSLRGGGLVQQISITNISQYTLKEDRAYIKSINWIEDKMHILRSDHYIETIDTKHFE